MAKIWLCRYGVPATGGGLLADRPFPDCVKQLRLRKAAHLGGVTATIQYGKPEDALAATNKGFCHVVVFLPQEEAGMYGWKAGYYHAPVTPKDAAGRLGAKMPAE